MLPTHERLNRIELELNLLRRSRAKWRAASLIAAATIAIGFLAGLATLPMAEVIRASRIELVDADGKVTALLSTSDQGGQLDIWGKGGANVARLAAAESGGDLSMWNTQGKPVVGMYASAGGGRFEVSRGNGELSAYFEATPEGSDLAMSRAGSEQAAARLRVTKDRSDALLARSEQNSVLLFGVTPKGGAVSILGENDREVAYFGGDQNQAGMLRLADKNGASMLEAGVGDHGGEMVAHSTHGQAASVLGNTEKGGFIEGRNPDGKAVASLSVQENGGGRISVGTASGQIAALMDQGKEESGTVQIYAGPNRTAALGGSATGGLLNLFNLQGKAVVVAGTATDGTGGVVSIRNGEGVQLIKSSAEPTPEVSVYSPDGAKKRVLAAP